MKKPNLYYIHFEKPDAVPDAIQSIKGIDPFASCDPILGSAVIVQTLLPTGDFQSRFRDAAGSSFVFIDAKTVSVSEWRPL